MSVRKEKEMTYAQTIAQRERIEEDVIAWLTAKSTEELRRFLGGSWTASILSPEEIEKLYHELQRREASPRDGTEEYFVEMSQD